MIRSIVFSVFLFIQVVHFQIFAQIPVSIIPKPTQMTVQSDSFALHKAKIVLPKNERGKRVALFFAEAVKQQTGINLQTTNGSNIIRFSYSNAIGNKEGYKISITTSHIDVIAKNDTGLFWAVQSLRQLLPIILKPAIYLPCLEITDAPAYEWRGNMLDVSRHFFSVEYVKRHIDMLSYYKMNVFHWHLTDDQGWRIEIKKYPELTKVGAWRKEADGSTYGGFYSQDQIKEVVRYANERNITVVPEIEMPGHCMAALAAYPELSCSKAALQVPNYWGVIQDVYCAGNEKTYLFVQDVLDEVLELFPSKYIHIGGDEVPKYRWRHCADCQKKMKEFGLKNEEELQSYFIKRMERYLESKGRVLIGWDEILEGGAGPDAIVEVWRGQDKAKEAIGNNNKIIQTLYFDANLISLNLMKTFTYTPEVVGRNEFVMGAECPLWTESQNEFSANYMIYPRVQAFSEVLWSGKTEYDDFRKRLEYHFQYMDSLNILYGVEDKPMLEMSLKYIPDRNYWVLYEERGNRKMDIRYGLNGMTPDFNSPSFTDSLVIFKPGTISVNTFFQNRQKGFPINYKIEQSKVLGLQPTYTKEPSEKYRKGGVYGMTDGITGTMNYSDGTWMGWFGDDVEMIVDLGVATDVSCFQINCMQQVQPWILLPQYVEFYTSENGIDWQFVSRVTHQVSDKDLRPQIYKFAAQQENSIRARFVKVAAKNYGKLPEWHNGAGNDSWIFVDEFIVR